MVLIGKKDEFTIYFNPNSQKYIVYKNNQELISKFRFVEVKSYLD